MSYGPDEVEVRRRSAVYAYKILKNSKSSHLAVEQATKFEFFINLKTAKTQSVAIPRHLHTLASEVIESSGASTVTSGCTHVGY